MITDYLKRLLEVKIKLFYNLHQVKELRPYHWVLFILPLNFRYLQHKPQLTPETQSGRVWHFSFHTERERPELSENKTIWTGVEIGGWQEDPIGPSRSPRVQRTTETIGRIKHCSPSLLRPWSRESELITNIPVPSILFP